MPTGLDDLIALARGTAARHALEPALICAVVEQESAWDAHAIRYEPGFRTRYVAPLVLPPTEEIARSISWGLMQVMGQVAREHGFTGKFLSALCEPAAGLDIGCAVLTAKLTIRSGSSSRESSPGRTTEGSLSAAPGDIARVLQLWNGGANPNYAAEVLARMARYK